MTFKPTTDMAYRNIEANCLQCGNKLVLRCARDIGRKKFCSKACTHQWLREKPGPAFPAFRESRKCSACGIDYIAVIQKQQFCSNICASRVIGTRHRKTHSNLKGHIKRLMIYKGRKELSVEFLLELFDKQDGKCALSGIPMTWSVGEGRVATNVSIDRISSYQGYSRDNVQLVCRVVNVMKQRLSNSDFVELCGKIFRFKNACNE